MASFDSLNAFSSRTDHPEKASRPFDRARNGLVPGGGGACIIIEELDHAISRGADIYCVIDGCCWVMFQCCGSLRTVG
jgi:3-oxoacyl-(acyl-carrier-protein) synthase